MTRVATSEEHAEACAIGGKIVDILEPWLAERFEHLSDDEGAEASRQVLARRLGWGLLMSVLLAASARGVNKLWLIEGLGVALGQVMAAQTPDIEGEIIDSLDCGIEAGHEDGENADALGQPMGSA